MANLADRVRVPVLLAGSAFGASLCTGLLAGTVHGLAVAVPLRFLTGVFLAGIYPVGMKLTASWSGTAERGRAFGVLIGCLTLGSALPHLINGLGGLPWRAVMVTAAVLTAVAGAVALAAVRPGPLLGSSSPPQARYAISAFRQPGPRLANLGYFGHMWELYALWTWLPIFLAEGLGAGRARAATVSMVAFLTIGVAGVAGALLGGWLADHAGRAPAAMGALIVSGCCCLLSPLFYGDAWVPLLVFLAVWGASVIADSGVFSTALSEVSDQRYVGTALTAQTAVGFLLTVVTIQFVPVLAGAVGWRYAFLLLAPGPAVGAVAMFRFGRYDAPDQKRRSDVATRSGLEAR
jgi:MFS family permease